MVLKLYGWFASGPALVAALILHEKNVPFEWVDVDLPAGEHKSEDYLAKFPFGLVPAIVSHPKPHITKPTCRQIGRQRVHSVRKQSHSPLSRGEVPQSRHPTIPKRS